LRENTLLTVFMKRTRDNPGIHAFVTQVGVTVTGSLVLLLFMIAAVPLIKYYFWSFFWRGLIAGLVGGGFSILFNWRSNRSLFNLARLVEKGEDLPERTKNELEAAVSTLPLRLFFLTLLLWPATTLTLGFWMNLAGILPLNDAIRLGITGVLYCPLQGFIFYYLARVSMRSLVNYLYSGDEDGHIVIGQLGLKARLIWSFVCLSIIPLLAGVILYGVHKEHEAIDRNLHRTCLALEALHAHGSGKDGSWDKAIKEVTAGTDLPGSIRFMVVDDSGGLQGGGMGWQARQVWDREFEDTKKAGFCDHHPIAGTSQYVAMRYFPDPGVYISASLYPLSETQHFSFFSGMTLVLSVFVIGLGTFLGYLAAGDVVKTLDGLSEQAAKLAKGRYTPISGIMVDKEIRGLVDSLNSLSESINQELKKSKMTVLETKEIINDLAQCSVELQNHADRQREILDEHGPMVTLAGDKTEQVTAAAGSIRNEAQASRDHMLEVFQHSGAAGDILRNLQEIVKGVDEASTVLVGEMEKLESNYLRMEEVVTIIDDVADRSEMVALNASLESSGSEGGRSRFSVVASEIQRLAESISRQTDAIKTIFNQVRDSSVEMVQYIEINRSKSADAPEWSSKLMQALEDIRMKSHNASGAMEKIEGRAVEQNEAVEQMRMVVGEIKSMADIMDQASSGTERTSRKLAELSQKLQEIVSLQKEKSPD